MEQKLWFLHKCYQNTVFRFKILILYLHFRNLENSGITVKEFFTNRKGRKTRIAKRFPSKKAKISFKLTSSSLWGVHILTFDFSNKTISGFKNSISKINNCGLIKIKWEINIARSLNAVLSITILLGQKNRNWEETYRDFINFAIRHTAKHKHPIEMYNCLSLTPTSCNM